MRHHIRHQAEQYLATREHLVKPAHNPRLQQITPIAQIHLLRKDGLTPQQLMMDTHIVVLVQKLLVQITLQHQNHLVNRWHTEQPQQLLTLQEIILVMMPVINVPTLVMAQTHGQQKLLV